MLEFFNSLGDFAKHHDLAFVMIVLGSYLLFLAAVNVAHRCYLRSVRRRRLDRWTPNPEVTHERQ